MKEIVINENEAGQRLDKFLGKLLKEAPASFYYKMLRKKNIVLNGKKATGNEKLTAGDSVKLFLSDETFEKFAGKQQTKDPVVSVPHISLEIVYEDHDVLAINKPAGMLSQKAKKEDISANEYILQYLLESGTITRESLHTFKPSVCQPVRPQHIGNLSCRKDPEWIAADEQSLSGTQYGKILSCDRRRAYFQAKTD